MFLTRSVETSRKDRRGFASSSAALLCLMLRLAGELAAGDQLVELSSVILGDRTGSDDQAVAQHRDAIGNLADLLHAMGDVDDRIAGAP